MPLAKTAQVDKMFQNRFPKPVDSSPLAGSQNLGCNYNEHLLICCGFSACPKEVGGGGQGTLLERVVAIVTKLRSNKVFS